MFYDEKQKQNDYKLFLEQPPQSDTNSNEEFHQEKDFVEIPNRSESKHNDHEHNYKEASEYESSNDDNYFEEESDDIENEHEQTKIDEIKTLQKRQRKPPCWTEDYQMFANCEENGEFNNTCEWDDAIKDEIIAHIKNDTWILEDLDKANNVIGCKIVLKEKLKPNGELERRKARLVAKGFAQKPGIDFDETFSPVAKLSSIRLLLGLAVEEDLIIDQMDVSTAFLNGEIQEKIYMELPTNIEKHLEQIMNDEKYSEDKTLFCKAKSMIDVLRKSKNKNVCLLKKAIYGLKQSGRQWFKKLDTKLKELKFTPSHADPCVYISNSEGSKTIIAVYVDDIIIASNTKKESNYIKSQLMKSFEMRDLGKLNYCLGIECNQKDGKIMISQTKYINELLENFNMKDCKPASTPLTPGLKLLKGNECDTNYCYQKLIGSLMYLSIGTRPDITHAVSYLSQFNSCYGKEHWIAAKRVLRYLQGSKQLALTFKKTGRPLVGMADADWACNEDRRSYTGYCFSFGGAVVSWESRKQRTIALSTCEAEYMSMTEAAKEAIHLKLLLNDMGKPHNEIQIFSDNQSALSMAKNSVVSNKSKHISIKEHFIREKVQNGEIKINYLQTEDMVADILTKGLNEPKLNKFIRKLGLSPALVG